MADDRDEPPGMRWLRPALAAEMLGVSERTLRRHVRAGRLQVRHEGRRVRILAPYHPEREPDRPPPGLAEAVEMLAEALAAERARSAHLEARVHALEEQQQLALALAPLHPAPAERPSRP